MELKMKNCKKKPYLLRYSVKDSACSDSFRSVTVNARTWPEAIGILNTMLFGFYKHYVISYKHFKVTF